MRVIKKWFPMIRGDGGPAKQWFLVVKGEVGPSPPPKKYPCFLRGEVINEQPLNRVLIRIIFTLANIDYLLVLLIINSNIVNMLKIYHQMRFSLSSLHPKQCTLFSKEIKLYQDLAMRISENQKILVWLVFLFNIWSVFSKLPRAIRPWSQPSKKGLLSLQGDITIPPFVDWISGDRIYTIWPTWS